MSKRPDFENPGRRKRGFKKIIIICFEVCEALKRWQHEIVFVFKRDWIPQQSESMARIKTDTSIRVKSKYRLNKY